MSSLQDYTDQQSRMATAFSFGGGTCTVYCEACGRTYFVTSAGHGDYEEGELERLRERAKSVPERYIEEPTYSSISTMCMPTDGKEVVVGCICDPTKTLSEFIENNAEQLTTYLKEYWRSMREKAARETRQADEALANLGWSKMSLAPKNATWVEVETKDDGIVQAHWASDLSGEEQPPFEGWFVRRGEGFRQVHPIHWRPIKAEATSEKH